MSVPSGTCEGQRKGEEEVVRPPYSVYTSLFVPRPSRLPLLPSVWCGSTSPGVRGSNEDVDVAVSNEDVDVVVPRRVSRFRRRREPRTVNVLSG